MKLTDRERTMVVNELFALADKYAKPIAPANVSESINVSDTFSALAKAILEKSSRFEGVA